MSTESFSLGSLIEGPAVFAPLAPNERVSLLVVEVSSEKKNARTTFKATLFGVFIGYVVATKSKAGTTWVWKGVA